MNTTIIQSIVWALVHSIWQAAVIFILYAIISKMMSKTSVNYRYLLSAIMLTLIPCSFAVTAVLIAGPSTSSSVHTDSIVKLSSLSSIQTATTTLANTLTIVSSWIDQNLLWVMRAWFIGSLIFMMRILSGITYLYLLRKNALTVTGVWEEKVRGLASGLKIGRNIRLAEARISSPVVIGFLKPVVLFPVGLMAGLTTTQVEAVLVHELAHIRRHDFLVNFFQCVTESVFFFNPFVWILSSRVRVLREHCCDDFVLAHGIEPITYVKTLAYVEESGSARMLAPALVGTRNHLLERMKRIMEKSIVKKEWGKMKLLPLCIALVGLVCASWLSIGSEEGFKTFAKPAVVPADTTDHKDQNDKVPYLVYRNEPERGVMLALPPADEGKPSVYVAPFVSDRFFLADSLPGFFYAPPQGWGVFEKEFTEKFREQFHEFFEKNHDQFEMMMKELREHHADSEPFKFEMHGWSPDQMKEMEQAFAHIDANFANPENFELPPVPVFDKEWIEEHAIELQAEDFARLEQQARAMSDMMRYDSDLLHVQEELLKLQEFQLMDNEKMLEQYEKELAEQLAQDGYLKRGEKLNELRIMNNEMSVNGKKVKEKDLKKYQELREKYQPRRSFPHRPE